MISIACPIFDRLFGHPLFSTTMPIRQPHLERKKSDFQSVFEIVFVPVSDLFCRGMRFLYVRAEFVVGAV